MWHTNYAAHVNKSKKDTRDLLSRYLLKAEGEQNWRAMTEIKNRLEFLYQQQAYRLVVRSRHQQQTETERASLFHLNRVVKNGEKGRLEVLAKEVDIKTEENVDEIFDEVLIEVMASVNRKLNTSEGDKVRRGAPGSAVIRQRRSVDKLPSQVQEQKRKKKPRVEVRSREEWAEMAI